MSWSLILANLPPFTQQQKALVKFVFFTRHMVWKPHVPVSCQCWKMWCFERSCRKPLLPMYEFIMFMLHTDNFTWTFRLCACVSECVLSIYLSSSLQKLLFISHTSTRLQIAAFVWCYELLSLLFTWLTIHLLGLWYRKLSLTFVTKQMMIYFFTIK